MSASSPSDLVVAYRGFARRGREALRTADNDPGRVTATRTHLEAVHRLVEQASAVIGGSHGTTVDDLGDSIAQSIAAIKPDAWDEAQLDQLRSLALQAGAELRNAERAAEA
jgi:GAF domain-containing protein